MSDDSTATDIDSRELASEETYAANVVVEVIQDLQEDTKSGEKVITEQVQDLNEFSVLETEVLAETVASRVIQGTITVSVTTTNKYMVEDVAVDKLREYIPEDFQIVDVELPDV